MPRDTRNQAGRLERRAGFSLVELLTVIGVIGVLVAMLLPAMARARAEALRVRCMSNLRQLLQAQMMYVSESRSHLTYPNWGHDRKSEDVWPTGWLYAQGRVSEPPRPDDVKAGALYRYLNTTAVFHCPSHQPEEESFKGTNRLTSYIMNGAVCGYGAVGHRGATPVVWAPSRKITDWRQPSEQILWWEAEEVGNDAASWNDGSSYPRENVLARRHGRGASVAFFDGHVGWMDRLDYLSELQRPGPNRLYCDSARSDGGKKAAGAFPSSE